MVFEARTGVFGKERHCYIHTGLTEHHLLLRYFIFSMSKDFSFKSVIFLVLICCESIVDKHAAHATRCSEGTYLHQQKDKSQCLPCPDGTFMPWPWKNHTQQKCFDCTKIDDPATEVLISPCDRFHNADVQCVEGFYRRQARSPRDKPICLRCREFCPERLFPAHPCKNFTDLACCEGENFVFDVKNLTCRERPWMCRRGHYLDEKMNDCKPCPENTFMPEDYHSNKKCWDCQYISEVDLPVHSVIIEPCTSTQAPRYGCTDGYYVNHGMSYRGDDIGCSPCQKCAEKMHVGRQCDGYHDTVCCDKPNMTVEDGQEGAQCLDTITCKNGKYNPPPCDKSCSQYCRASERRDVSPCDHINGSCLFGCLGSYIGTLCDTRHDNGNKFESKERADANIGIAPLVVVSVLLVLIVASGIIYYVYTKHPGAALRLWQWIVRRLPAGNTRNNLEEDVEEQQPLREIRQSAAENTGERVEGGVDQQQPSTIIRQSAAENTGERVEGDVDQQQPSTIIRQSAAENTRERVEGGVEQQQPSTIIRQSAAENTRERVEGDVEQQQPSTINMSSKQTEPKSVLDEIKKRVKKAVETLQSMETHQSKAAYSCQNEISDIFWDYFEFRKEIGDLLVEMEFPETCMTILRKHLKAKQTLHDISVWSVTGTTYSVCRNHIASSSSFAKRLAELCVVKLLTSILKDKHFIDKQDGTMESHVIKLSLVGLRLTFLYAGNTQDFEEANIKEVVGPFINSSDQSIKILAVITESCIEGRENETQEIQPLMMQREEDPCNPHDMHDVEKANRVRKVFVENIIPMKIVHIFHFYNSAVLSLQDIELVTTASKKGNDYGAAELLYRLVKYKYWYECLTLVLLDPQVKLGHVVDMMEDVLARQSSL